MQGCGSRIWKRADGSITAAEGKFWGDEYVGDVMPCGGGDAAEYALDADMAAYQGRSFQVRRAPARRRTVNHTPHARARTAR